LIKFLTEIVNKVNIIIQPKFIIKRTQFLSIIVCTVPPLSCRKSKCHSLIYPRFQPGSLDSGRGLIDAPTFSPGFSCLSPDLFSLSVLGSNCCSQAHHFLQIVVWLTLYYHL